MSCTCRNLTRVSDTDLKGFEHHSNCELHKQNRYVKVSLDGGAYVVPINKLQTFVSEIEESEGENTWVVETIYMSELEFNKLEEFQGH